MRMSGYHRGSGARFDVQMTPMIDVVFQLLIFFVCTVNFQKQELALKAVQQAQQAQGALSTNTPPPPELEDLRQVTIDLKRANGATQWLVNGAVSSTLREVETRLSTLARVGDVRNVVPVVLDATDDVPISDAVDVYDLCLRLGFAKVQFAAPEP